MPTTASFVIRAALWQQGTARALLPSVEAQATVQLHVDVPKFQLAGLIAAAGETGTMVKGLWVVRATGSPHPTRQHGAHPFQPSHAWIRTDTHTLYPRTHWCMDFPACCWVWELLLAPPAHAPCQDPSYQRDRAALEATTARAPK